MAAESQTAVEVFKQHNADEINEMAGSVSGWVPAGEVDSLINAVPEADVQYFTDDGYEAFVTTL